MGKQKVDISIESSIRTYLILVVFSLVAMISYLYGCISSLISYYNGESGNIYPAIILGLVFILVLQIFLWFFRGVERLEITSDELFFIRTNGILIIKRRVRIEKVNSISVNYDKYSSENFLDSRRQRIWDIQGAIFWFNIGKLEFKIGKQRKTFFNGMKDVEAMETVVYLNKHLKIPTER